MKHDKMRLHVQSLNEVYNEAFSLSFVVLATLTSFMASTSSSSSSFASFQSWQSKEALVHVTHLNFIISPPSPSFFALVFFLNYMMQFYEVYY